MGQALEYAANLWEMSYEEFDDMVLDSEGRPLAELMSERVPAEEWSQEEFQKSVVSALQQGNFRLVMTVEGLTSELKQTIKFLNARGPFSFETYAMELQHFSDGEVEIVVPKIMSFAEPEIGQGTTKEGTTAFQAPSSAEPTVARSEPSAKGPNSSSIAEPKPQAQSSGLPEPTIAQSKQDEGNDDKEKEALFFVKCSETVSEKALEMIKKLYDFSTGAADEIIWWGSNGAGAFNFVLTDNGLTVFIVDANGRIMFNFSDWQREPSYKNLLPQFLEKLKGITILRNQKEDYARWPDFSMEEFFANPNDFAVFEESIRFLKEELNNLAVA